MTEGFGQLWVSILMRRAALGLLAAAGTGTGRPGGKSKRSKGQRIQTQNDDRRGAIQRHEGSSNPQALDYKGETILERLVRAETSVT